MVPLTKGRFAIVDIGDLGKVVQHYWQAVLLPHTTYAGATINKKRVLMHRFIMEPSDGLEVDHINRNGLDNRRENLRIATRSQNNGNTKIPSHNTSGVKGVSYDKDRNLWAAHIKTHGRKKFLGRFGTKEEAASAYDRAAAQHFGEFANKNGDL